MEFWSLAREKLSHHGDLKPEEERKREEIKKGVRCGGGGCKVIKENEGKHRGQSNEIMSLLFWALCKCEGAS